MDIYKELKIHEKDRDRIVFFGEVTSPEELEKVFKLRYEIYSYRNYINKENYKNGLEIDDYDIPSKSHYFIAKIEEKVIGCVRVITDNPLPTEKCFHFNEPEEIKSIPIQNRCELGRLIIIPPDREKGDFLPRGLVMLFLFDTLSAYATKNNLYGGYSFIKKTLEVKLKKLNIPVGEIKDYKQDYPKDGVLYNYFNQPDDPVIPVYFLTKDFSDYTKKTIHNSWMFSDDGDGKFTLKTNLYTDFLKMLKII
ncbi:MAG: GNAT family N-acyltransferase [Candidatus Paceibacterota bacterium]